jgi:Tfp pilus assembly protein PilV
MDWERLDSGSLMIIRRHIGDLKRPLNRGSEAFSLIEVVIALAVSAVSILGIVEGYIFTAKRAEWSAYNLAAQSLAVQRLEQARAAKWDRLSTPSVDELVSSNFPVVVNILDIPVTSNGDASGLAAQFPVTLPAAAVLAAYARTNDITFVYATNYTAIWSVSVNPPLKAVQVDCVWGFLNRGLFTNTVITYRAPDQ